MASVASPVPDPQIERTPTAGPPPGREPMTELALEVVGVVDVSPSMRRLTLRSDALADFSYVPGQDLSFTIPVDDRMVRRRYTIRQHRRRTPHRRRRLRVARPRPRRAWATDGAPARHRDRRRPARQDRAPARRRLAPPGRRRLRDPRHVGAPRGGPRRHLGRRRARGRGQRRTNRPRTDPSRGCTGSEHRWATRHSSSPTSARSSCRTATEPSTSTENAA